MGKRQAFRPKALLERNGRRYRYWKKVIASWQRSGLSQREYCQQRQIPRGTFSWWKWKLKQLASEASQRLEDENACKPSSLLPVRIVTKEDEKSAPPPQGIEVVLSTGRSLRIHGDFDPQVLAKIVAVLEKQQC